MAGIPQPGDSVGPYTVGERLGHGAHGTVFRATRSRPRREVALKVIAGELAELPGFRDQFLHEADLLAGLDSPHVIGIQDMGEEDGVLFIATELVAGGDLGTRLVRGPVPLRPALILAAQVSAALSVAHRAGIVHGDVKPSNVLLGEREGRPHALLCDFGIARPAGAGGTRRSTVVGTYAYLAPEVLTGGAASTASDVYALGCLLVAAITGTPPYQGTDEEIAQQHLTSEIPRWEETSPLLGDLNRVVRTAMAKDPADRFATAEDFGAAITEVLGSVPEAAPVPPAAAAAAGTEPSEPAPVAEPDSDEPGRDEPGRDEPGRDEPGLDEQRGDGAAPPRRSGRVLVSSLVALALVGAAVAGIVLLQGENDSPKPSAQPTTSTSSTTAPATTPTPSPTATRTNPVDANGNKTCQEGRVVKAAERCGEPYGIAGLRYVFPKMSGDCKAARLNTDKYWQIVCTVGGAEPATLTYSTFKTGPIGIQHDEEQYRGRPITLPSGLLQYGPEQMPDGKWQLSMIYPEKHPYGVQIEAGSSQAAQQIADRTEVLAPGDFIIG